MSKTELSFPSNVLLSQRIAPPRDQNWKSGYSPHTSLSLLSLIQSITKSCHFCLSNPSICLPSQGCRHNSCHCPPLHRSPSFHPAPQGAYLLLLLLKTPRQLSERKPASITFSPTPFPSFTPPSLSNEPPFSPLPASRLVVSPNSMSCFSPV